MGPLRHSDSVLRFSGARRYLSKLRLRDAESRRLGRFRVTSAYDPKRAIAFTALTRIHAHLSGERI